MRCERCQAYSVATNQVGPRWSRLARKVLVLCGRCSW